MKNKKPDQYFNNGIIEIARFGEKVVTRNVAGKTLTEKIYKELISNLPIIKSEINELIKKIRAKVQNCNPLGLLDFAYSSFLLSMLGITSEFQLTFSNISISQFVDYIQSILVSSANHNSENDDDPSELYNEILSDYCKLRESIQQFYFSWATDIRNNAPSDDVIDKLVEAQMMFTVSGNRYQKHETEYIERLISAHDNELRKLFGVGAKEITDGFTKLQYSLSQGKINGFNEFGKFIDSIDSESLDSDNIDPTISQKGYDLLTTMLGSKSNDVIEVTGWPECFVRELSFGIDEEESFFSDSEYSGWPVINLPIQKRPFIKIDDRYYCFSYYAFVDCFYRSVQKAITRLDTSYKWSDVQKEASETMAANVLGQILPNSEVYTSNYYPNGRKIDYPENDILVVYNDVLIIAEVKAGSFVFTAPLTDFDAHKISYKTLLEKASDQCQRTKDYLYSSKNPMLYNFDHSPKVAIDMQKITDVFMLSITIDNINTLAAKAEKLSFLKMNSGTICLAIDDLMVYRDYFDSPLEFLHFLKQRREATYNEKLALNDELDHLGMYISHNMYTLQTQGYDKKTIPHQIGYREELDEYFSNLYLNKRIVDKPKQKIPQMYRDILSYIQNSDIHNKYQISSYLLDFDSSIRQYLSDSISVTLKRHRINNFMSALSTSGTGNSLRYTCFVNQPKIVPQISDESKRKYVLSSLVWNQDSDRTMIDLFFDEDEHIISLDFKVFTKDDILEDEHDELWANGQRTAQSRLTAYMKEHKKIGRNERCPCGSGKKYKKCCGFYK